MQKVIQAGNSAAITIPKEYLDVLQSKIGSHVQIKLDPDMRQIIVDFPNKSKKQATRPIAKEFQQWLDSFIKEDENLIKELANR